jgi:hypothetical protein
MIVERIDHAATELEQHASIALFDQPIRVTLEAWPRSCWLPLPIAPLIDPMSPAVTVDGEPFDGFAVIAGLRPALRLTGQRPRGLIVIEYQAGFGDALTDLPIDLQEAYVLLHPETGHGANLEGNASAKFALASFVDDTAAKTEVFR